MTPLAIDLFCGLGGWTEGLLAEGYRVVGFDTERHAYGADRYPGQLVIQDVLTLDGRQFHGADLIVASPPCQAYSYRAMPWSRAKALPPPDNSLFDACFRIQREASAAAGRHIPLVVENVRGAQKWVGKAPYHFGSFYLWGDIPALMPNTVPRSKRPGHDWSKFKETGEVSAHWRMNGEDWTKGTPGQKTTAHPNRRDGHRSTSHLTNPAEHIKNGGDWFGSGKDCSYQRKFSGTKQAGISGPRANGKGDRWFQDGAARHGSKSSARKRASALIAKIPLTLSRHIGAAWHPRGA